LDLSAIAFPPVFRYLPQAANTGPTTLWRHRDTESESANAEAVCGMLVRALWCLVPHVVSGLATNIPYLNESGCRKHIPARC
jgi:hypothetical protein